MVPFPHAPYSSDLALCDFFLFPRMKKDSKLTTLKRSRKTRKELSAISKDEYEKCFEQWKHWWDKCISCKGKYKYKRKTWKG